MDINLFTPINVRVKDVLNDSYTITWDISAAAKAELANSSDIPSITIYGRDATSSIVSVLGTTSANDTKFEFAIKSGISEVYLTAKFDTNESGPSASVALLSTNIMSENYGIAIGRDEKGNVRMLATTEDGVVKVTGTTVNNYGGDASAANQVSGLAKADTLINSANDIKASVDNVNSNLGSVGLNASTVLALQTVAVTNIPNDFPDVATTSAINDFKFVAAKDSSLATIISNTNNALKSTDLSLNAGVLDSNITNFPTDFPDSALLAEQVAHRDNLINIDVSMDHANDTLTDIYTVANLNKDTNVSSLAALNGIDTRIDTSNTNLVSIASATADTNTNTQLNGTKLDGIAIMTANLLKTSDLNLTAGTLSVREANPITDFPDSVAQAKLADIQTSIDNLGNSRVITFGESLPAGTANIGSVNVSSSVLPPDAATETTLNNALNSLNVGNANTSNLRIMAAEMSSKLDAMLASYSAPKQDVVYDIVHDVNNEMIIRPEAEVEPALLTRYGKYVLQIFSYDNIGNVSLLRETALDNNNYYHTMPHYNRMAISQKAVFETELTLVRNIAIKFIGSGKFRVRITGIE